MASSYTSSLGLENPATGDQTNTWGTTENTGRTLVDQAVAGWLEVDCSAGGTITLTSTSGASNQARNAMLYLTGTLPSNTHIVIPNVSKLYVVEDATTRAGFTLDIGTSGGTLATLTNGISRGVKCDGAGTTSFCETAATGTVTSVGLSLPAILTVSGSPVTTSGTLTATLADASANAVLSGPTSGGATTPAFRALVAADMPSSVAQLNVAGAWTAQQGSTVATLTDGATISWAVGTKQFAQVTLGGNRTMAAPSGIVDGVVYTLRVIQDGTGSRTLTWNAAYHFGSAGTPTLSTAPSAADYLCFVGRGTTVLDCMGIRTGY